MTLDFARFLLSSYLENGLQKQGEDMLLNPKYSMQLYPLDLWNIYFEQQLKKGDSPIHLVDRIKTKTALKDGLDDIYNLILEKHIGLFRRDNPRDFLKLSDSLIERKV